MIVHICSWFLVTQAKISRCNMIVVQMRIASRENLLYYHRHATQDVHIRFAGPTE